MISGKTKLIAHIGYPTETFKAPQIYNPWFEKAGIDAVVVPMGVKANDYPQVLKALSKVVEGTPRVGTAVVSNSTFHKIAAQAA